MDATFAQIADKGTFSTELPEGLVPDATQSVLDL
jgi:ATP-binding protein